MCPGGKKKAAERRTGKTKRLREGPLQDDDTLPRVQNERLRGKKKVIAKTRGISGDELNMFIAEVVLNLKSWNLEF